MACHWSEAETTGVCTWVVDVLDHHPHANVDVLLGLVEFRVTAKVETFEGALLIFRVSRFPTPEGVASSPSPRESVLISLQGTSRRMDPWMLLLTLVVIAQSGLRDLWKDHHRST